MNDAVPSALPSPGPRPPGERELLQRIWSTPRGFRIVTAVNNTVIGLIYIGAAFLFFILAGVLALIMRAQLAVGENALISQDFYNQIFTVHGTTMMFLFAIPLIEGIGALVLPQLLGGRELPYPRLSAFAYWTFLFGGVIFYMSFLFDAAPDVTVTDPEYVPALSPLGFTPTVNEVGVDPLGGFKVIQD